MDLPSATGEPLPFIGGDATIPAIDDATIHAMSDSMTDTMITMDGSGRLVIPKEIRKLLHLTSGSVLRFALVGNRLELTPMESPGPKLRPKSGLMVVPRTGQAFDAVAALTATRASRP